MIVPHLKIPAVKMARSVMEIRLFVVASASTVFKEKSIRSRDQVMPGTPALAPNAGQIHAMNIAGRIGNVANAHKNVAALPRGSMPPPPTIPARPRVSVPSAWDLAAPVSAGSSALVWTDKGYSANHAVYQPNHASWAKTAYVGRPNESLNLLVGIRYEAERKKQGETYGTISEGTVVQGLASFEDIFNHVWAMMYEQLCADADFKFQPTELTVRDYTKPGKSAGQFNFVAPKTPIPVALVISGREWKRHRDYILDAEAEASEAIELEQETRNNLVSMRQLLSPDRLPMKNKNSGSGLSARTRSKHDKSQGISVQRSRDKVSVSSESSNRSGTRSCRLSDSHFTVSDLSQPEEDSSSKFGLLGAALWSQNAQQNDDRPITPPSIGQKRPHQGYRSPDHADFAQLRKALSDGGQFSRSGPLGMFPCSPTALGYLPQKPDLPTSERIEFYRVVPCSIAELFDGSGLLFKCDPASSEAGTLSILLVSTLGEGAFKDARPGFLTLTRAPSNGLGSSPNERVAVKQMIHSKNEHGSSKRFDVKNEFRLTVSEGNLLLWAISLFDFSLSFVHSCLQTIGTPPSTLIVPDIRFVEGGVALVHDITTGPNVQVASSLRQSLLIEELIPSPFVKFVHNRAPVPHLTVTHELYYIAEFLCFTQHIQYEKSGGLVFISDYQGSKEVLLDPQIMTSPDIGNNGSMFGGGNVAQLFEDFPKKHQCSAYCQFFGLKPLP
ncbi:unnamed protein product [Mycena citricolor]|uniref:Alpha-type protein kinase domain-containing protein n=1 Tax=Mycena citricolor TaxID=2018698 RepID=A0AAD2HJR2_9AGAR|nr:unnamed protein product [Mycena citricolor]